MGGREMKRVCALACVQVKLWAMTDKLGITPKLKSDDKELVGKPLMKRIMQTWLPAHEVCTAIKPSMLEPIGFLTLVATP